jgi:hypothetical protein
MKPKATVVGALSAILYALMISAQQGDFPALQGPYLGQKPPGMMPELFDRESSLQALPKDVFAFQVMAAF